MTAFGSLADWPLFNGKCKQPPSTQRINSVRVAYRSTAGIITSRLVLIPLAYVSQQMSKDASPVGGDESCE